jgi:hypothetical protein
LATRLQAKPRPLTVTTSTRPLVATDARYRCPLAALSGVLVATVAEELEPPLPTSSNKTSPLPHVST